MKITQILSLVLAVSFLNITAHAQGEADPVAVQPPVGKFPENLVLNGDDDGRPEYIFIADKENRTLTVWSHKKGLPVLQGAYPMDIGKLQGEKTKADDHRTPEGIYFFQERKEGHAIDFKLYGRRAFTLDYPNFFDQRAHKTGSGIWLHAVPDTTSLMRGSRGCVVVRNKIIDKLTPFIQLKSTPLLILDKVKYVTAEELTEKRKELQGWVDTWRAAWETKNLEDYMKNYAADFKAMKMNKTKWRQYKEFLAKKYSFIKVAVKNPFLVVRHDEAIISFLQDYDSDGLKDKGEKTLYVKQLGQGHFEILTELWQPLTLSLSGR